MASTIELDETDEHEGQESTGAETETQDDAEGADEPALREDGKPFTKTDLANLKDALTKARKDARAAKRGAKAGSQPESEGEKPDTDAIRREVEGKYKPLLVRTAARAALAESGAVVGKRLDRVVRLLDLDDLEVGEDGTVDGLDDQIEEIKEDFPELFTAEKPKRPGGGVDGADKGGRTPKKDTSSAAQIAAQLFGKKR